MRGKAFLSGLLLGILLLVGWRAASPAAAGVSARPASEGKAAAIQGLRTAKYAVADLARAKAWYTTVLGKSPYYEDANYIGFNVGGYELGLVPAGKGATQGENEIIYWGVADARAAYKRLLDLGGRKQEEPTDVGGGILIASVYDPFGNIFAVIENPHFKLEPAVTSPSTPREMETGE